MVLKKSGRKSTPSSIVKQVPVYEQFLKEESRVSFNFFQDKVTKETKWGDMTGPEKIKVFSKVSIPTLFPTIPKTTRVHKLWTVFFSMHQTLRSAEKTSHVIFQSHAANWLKLFKEVYQTKHITPYIHLLYLSGIFLSF